MYILKIWNTALVLLALNLTSLRNISTAKLEENIEHLQIPRATDSIIINDDKAETGAIASKNKSVDVGQNTSTTDYISSKGADLKLHGIKKGLLKFSVDSNPLIKLKNDTKYQKTKGSELDGKKLMSSTSSTESSTMFLPTMQSIADIHDETETIINATLSHVPHEISSNNFSLISSMMDSTTLMRGRALNVTTPDLTNSLYGNITDLSDVSMNEDDEEIEDEKYGVTHDETSSTHLPIHFANTSICVDHNKTYTFGESIVRGCDEKCICGENGKIMNCMPLCTTPYVRASQVNRDPLCHEEKIDTLGCCAILSCTDSAMEPEETCLFGNKTLIRGQRIERGCAEICFCETGGVLKCQPRCPPNETNSVMKYHDRCVALADPRDPCCTITYCDVSLGEDEIKSENVSNLAIKLSDIKFLNATTIKLTLSSNLTNETIVEISENNHLWRQQKPEKGGIIANLEPTQSYYVRIKQGDQTGPALRVIMPAEVIKTNITMKIDKNSCNHRGKQYKIGTEWYDDCLSICMCNEGAKVECITIECPTDFGLDVLDPHCLDWETVPPNFVPKAPNCCPQEVRCRNNGSCIYENKTYDNWSDIPSNITGCEKRCYCELGKISCQATCPPVSASPPPTLRCLPHSAVLARLPNDDCCSHWVCDHSSQYTPDVQDHHLHNAFPINGAIPEFAGQLPGQSSAHGITIQAIDPLSDQSVRVVFTVSPVLVGLHGRVELRYTKDKSNLDPATWESQVFVPPNDLIETPQFEFNLDGLEPATEYNVKVTVYLRDLANSPTSQIYTVRTLDKYEKQTTQPLQIPIDADIGITETNSTWVKVTWKKFTEHEMQFIDGVQLRYKEHDSKVYAATPLIHRAVTSYLIENLKSATTYEIGISIIPFPGQTTELISEKTIEVTTAVEPDPYSFDVKIEIKTVKSHDIEITWTGVPYPQDKYVNIYRAIYQSDSGKGDTSTFKIAKRDSTARTVISDLKPGTRYRLWLEIYLTNGKIKKSNVQDFVTKPGIILSPEISHQGKLASIPLHEGDYYGPLVIVAIVASLSILSTLILLMILMRRKSHNKADISSRKSTSAYDNPSYKVEIQQETMDL